MSLRGREADSLCSLRAFPLMTQSGPPTPLTSAPPTSSQWAEDAEMICARYGTAIRARRIRHDLLRFGLLYSHRRCLSYVNLLIGGKRNSYVLAPAHRPFAVAPPRPVPSPEDRPLPPQG